MQVLKRLPIGVGMVAAVVLLLVMAGGGPQGSTSVAGASVSVVCDSTDPNFELLSEEVTPEKITTTFFYRSAVGTDYEVRMRTQLIVPNNQPQAAAGWPVVNYNHAGGDLLETGFYGDYPERLGIALLTMTQQGMGKSGVTNSPPSGAGVPPLGKGWYPDYAGEADQRHTKEVINFVVHHCGIDKNNIGITGSCYGQLITWNTLATDLSDVDWKFKTAAAGPLVATTGSIAYAQYTATDDEGRYGPIVSSAVVRRIGALAALVDYYNRMYWAVQDRTDLDWLEQQFAERSAWPDPERFQNLLNNVTSKAVFITKAQRGMDFSANDAFLMIPALLEDGFLVKALFTSRDHNGLTYDPNFVAEDLNCVYRRDDPRFNQDDPACAAVPTFPPPATLDFGAVAVENEYQASQSERWFRYWLKGEDTGILDEPLYRYLNASFYPGDTLDPETGYEHFDTSSYPPKTRSVRLYLGDGGTLSTLPSWKKGSETLVHRFDGTMPSDLFINDQYSYFQRNELVFDSPPLKDDIVVLGIPKVHFAVSSDNEEYSLVASLYDVSPSGEANLISWASVFELEQEPGKVSLINGDANFRVHRFREGHSIRVVISGVGHLIGAGGQGVNGPTVWWTLPSYEDSDTTIYFDNWWGWKKSWISLPVLKTYPGFPFPWWWPFWWF